MPGLGIGHAALLLGNGGALVFHLLLEVALDLRFAFARRLRQRGQLFVVLIPALGGEKPVRLIKMATCNRPADIGDDPGHLVLRAKFRRADALRRWKDRREQAVE